MMADPTNKESDKGGAARLLVMPAVLWLLLFLVAPLAIVVLVSLATRGPYGKTVYDFTVTNYVRAIDPLYLRAYWRTVWIASATTALCVLVSFPAAYYLALRAPKRWKRPLLVLTVIPFWTSFLIRTYAWILLLRSEGVINSALMQAGLISEPLRLLYSDFAVLVGQVYGELPFMILPIYVALERLDLRLLEAAQDLGANRFWTFVKVTLPLSRPGLIAGVVLVFIPSLGAFITPDLLGGAKSVMIGNLIQNQFSQLNQPFGSALSLILTAAVLLLLALALKSGLKASELA
ncbi:MAG TPA: ABC transporter permease [Blastocatellia bacterium]|jgi:spermidine/putrescine transport system permease protein|nr:ABC transporter permease [Blastocatellia bacterium]